MKKLSAIKFCIPVIAILAGCETTSPISQGNVPNGSKPAIPPPTAPAVSPAAPAAPAPAAPAAPQSSNNRTNNYLNLTPMTALSWPSVKSVNRGEPVNYSDAYARIRIAAVGGCIDLEDVDACKQAPGVPLNQNSTETAETDASMGYPETGLFSRYFVQPQRSITVAANISAGEFVATVPLLSLSHIGGRTGDAWSRTIYSSVADLPWFLVKPDGSNSVLSARFTLSATKSIQFQGAVTGLNVAVSLARQFAPQGTLITSLTAATAKTRSEALDKTISSLFAMTIAEQHSADLDFRRWHREDKLKLDVSVPSGSSINGVVSPIGSWTLSLEDPRPSIFVDVRVCQSSNGNTCIPQLDAAKDTIVALVQAADVLSFSIVPLAPPNSALGTIGTYISQHDGFSTSLASIAAEKDTSLSAKSAPSLAGAQLCKNIRQWTAVLGFSSLDQDIILWAVATGLPGVPATTGAKILGACSGIWLQKLNARDAAVQAAKQPAKR